MRRIHASTTTLLVAAAVVLAAALPAPAASTSGSGAAAPPPVRMHGAAGHWGFALFKGVDAARVRKLMPPSFASWTLRGCKQKPTGEFDEMAPGTADVVLVTKQDHLDTYPPNVEAAVTHLGIFTCANPPDDGREYRPAENEFGPVEDRNYVQIAGWIDAPKHARLEARYGMQNHIATFAYVDDPASADHFGFTARDVDGRLIANTEFDARLAPCLDVGHNLRLWHVGETGGVAAYDMYIPTGSLRACYGSATTVRFDSGTVLDTLFDTPVAVANVAGTERSDDVTTTISKLFP
ncbi:MAG TPA: hypothetical protein VM345_05245 [Acidimicrobiales bacterium]|nr:hypothetical protein [Acidimicrobiales bacterium]